MVSKSNATVYNPAIVSVNIPNASVNAADGGTVDLNNAFANGKVAFLKRSTPTMEKNIIVDGQKKKGDLVSADGVGSTVADEITFQIDTQLPSYQVGENGSVYKNPRFEISDKLQDVFENISEIKIQNAAGDDLVANTDYELVNGVGSKDFTVKFKSEYLMAHGNEAVKIVYKTKLTSTETNQNFADNKNVATLKYSNDPTNEQSVKIVKDKTYHYTFSIDGNIDGTWEESGSTIDGKQGKHQTHELNKVTERTESTTWEEKEDEAHTFTKHSTKALEGAKFGLYSDEDAQTKVAETTSTDKGFMSFHGLEDTSGLAIESDSDLITLITCTPYGVNSHRLLVRGRRVDPVPIEQKKITPIEQVSNMPIKEKALAIGLVISPILLIVLVINDRRKEKRKKQGK